MALFTIDESKCLLDSVCSEVCPASLVENRDGIFPSPIPNADDACIECWHCVMSCPTGAFLHKSMESSSCLPLSKERLPSVDQIELLYMSRKSTRVFLSKNISHDVITRLLKLSQLGPNCHNFRRLEWIVIHDRSTIRELTRLMIGLMQTRVESGDYDNSPHFSVWANSWLNEWGNGTDRILHDAPVILICYVPSDDDFLINDCSIALTYIELAAASMGLGTCWMGFFQNIVNNHKPVTDKVGLPEGYSCVGAMVLGYPKHQKERLAPSEPLKVRWM